MTTRLIWEGHSQSTVSNKALLGALEVIANLSQQVEDVKF